MRVLTLTTVVPLASAAALALLPVKEKARRRFFIACSTLGAAACLWFFVRYNPVADNLPSLWYGEKAVPILPRWGVQYAPAADGISLLLALLVSALACAASVFYKDADRTVAGLLLTATGAAVGAFFTTDLFLFLVLSESAITATIFLAASSRTQAAGAARSALTVQALTGLPVWIALLTMAWRGDPTGFLPADLLQSGIEIRLGQKYWLMACFVITFGARIPLLPFQSWLSDLQEAAHPALAPNVHVIISALGLYGLARFAVPLFPMASPVAAPILGIIASAGFIHMGMIAYVGTRSGRVMSHACSALASLVAVGIVTATRTSLAGAFLLVAGEGLAFAAFFYVLAALSERGHPSMTHVASTMPRIIFFMGLGVLAITGIPGTAGFVAQVLTLAGAFDEHPIIAGIATLGLAPITVALVSILRQAGEIDPTFVPDKNANLRIRESAPLAVLIFLTFFLGIFPNAVLTRLNPAAERLAEEIHHRRALAEKIEEPFRTVEDFFEEENEPPPALPPEEEEVEP